MAPLSRMVVVLIFFAGWGPRTADAVHGENEMEAMVAIAKEDEIAAVNGTHLGGPTEEELFDLAAQMVKDEAFPWLRLKKKIAAGTAGTIYIAEVTKAPSDDAARELLPDSAAVLSPGNIVVVKDSFIGKDGESNCEKFKCELRRMRGPCAEARKEEMYYTKLLTNFGYHGSIARPFGFKEACDSSGRPHHLMVMEFLTSPSTFEDCLSNPPPRNSTIGEQKPGDCRVMQADEADVNELVRVWTELVEGYKFLCNAGIVQQDGWKENRVLAKGEDGKWHAKIVDFGKGADDASKCGKDLDILLETARGISKFRPGWEKRSSALKKFVKALECKVAVPEKNGLFGNWGCANAKDKDDRGDLKVSHVYALEIYAELLQALKK